VYVYRNNPEEYKFVEYTDLENGKTSPVFSIPIGQPKQIRETDRYVTDFGVC
jgi:hypothetical protein